MGEGISDVPACPAVSQTHRNSWDTGEDDFWGPSVVRNLGIFLQSIRKNQQREHSNVRERDEFCFGGIGRLNRTPYLHISNAPTREETANNQGIRVIVGGL